jgi:Leucine-rich repeat (LRR) protein
MTHIITTTIQKRFLWAFLLLNLVAAQAQNVPDLVFAAAIRSQCPTCIDAGNNLLLPAASRRALYLNFLGVTNLEGIQGFINLETLECEGGVNTLSSIPAGILPASLKALKLNGNRITSLPALPAGLLALWCSRNQLTSLPALPPALYDLQVEQNMLTSLPALPATLDLLNVVNNRLTSLPALPNSLTKLYCLRNQLTSLPTLPGGLENLYCMFNAITSLPTLPNSLIDLRLDQAKITCLPNVPPGLTVFNQSEFVIPTPPVCGLDVPDPNFAAAIRSVCPTCITPLPNRRLLPPAANFTFMNVRGKGISDLTGIQGFTSLQELFCYDNRLATLPPLPSTLTLLSCFNNQLTSLSLPSGLKELYCYDNPLGGLPNTLPSGLQKLNCFNNLFPTIPTLPNSMTQLIVNTSVISCLPNLPPSMTVYSSTAPLTVVVLPICGAEIDVPDPNFAAAIRLQCPTCITALPNHSLLPPAANLASLNVSGKNISDLTGIRGFTSLQSLFCFNNRLATLPPLPSTLRELSCFDNQLTSLSLPSGLTSLYCYDNPISNLPNPLPSGLQVLNCVRSLYTRLPTLPSTMTRLLLSPAIITCLPNIVAGMQVYNEAFAAIPTPPLCPPPPICSPMINMSPASQINLCAQTNVIINAQATGTAGATVKWQRRRPSDANFIDVTPPVTYVSNEVISYIVTVSIADNGTQFRAVFTGSCAGSGPIPTAATTISVRNGTRIPDLYFRNAISRACPECIDGCGILTEEATKIKSLNVDNASSFQPITDLTGIEGFINLEILNISSNSITNFQRLPSSLLSLTINNHKLNTLPELPNTLMTLICKNNNLASLPALPSSLMHLDCSSNKITVLPADLPESLMVLDCSNNLLIGLPPTLPVGLKTIYCHKNQISTLPTLPSALTFFNCGNNQLSDLPPTLPPYLWILVCSRNPNLFCLPILPQSLHELYVSPENVKCLRNSIRTLRVYDAMNEPINLPMCNATTCVPFNGLDTEGGIALKSNSGKTSQLNILKIYPNPVDKQFQVEFNVEAEGITTIMVNDVLGRFVSSQKVSVTKGTNLVSFDMSEAPRGMYILTVNDGKVQESRQIIKN